jgi:hypothetical protein
MNRLPRSLAFAGALCVAASLAAQAPPAVPPADNDDIVVTGKHPGQPGNEAFDQARKLSRIDRPYEQALARFEKPVCPGIFGLKTDYAIAMLDRMRENAARQHVPLAKGGCTPNLIVAFVEDGQSLLGRLTRNEPQIFSFVPASEREALLTEASPVRVWSNVQTRLVSGAPVRRFRGREELPSVRGALNRFTLPTRRDIQSALVVFDRKAVRGMTLVQLADYATMRGLTHTRPASGDEPMATILSLFDAEPAPAELTGFDQSYLRTVYYWGPTYSAATKFVGIGGRAAEGKDETAKPPR